MTNAALQVVSQIAEACNAKGKAPSLFTISRDEYARVRQELSDLKGDRIWISGVEVAGWDHPIGPIWEETHGL